MSKGCKTYESIKPARDWPVIVFWLVFVGLLIGMFFEKEPRPEIVCVDTASGQTACGEPVVR